MLKIENRESAHVKSRVKDLSKVPNLISYTGLFAAVTPLSKEDPVDGVYAPIMIRDIDSLVENFGDPRIDPKRYIDLYTVMQIVNSGTTCYVNKVSSGKSGEYLIVAHSEAPSSRLTLTPEEGSDNKVFVSEDLDEDYVACQVSLGGTLMDPPNFKSETVPSGDNKYKIRVTFLESKTETVTVSKVAKRSLGIRVESVIPDVLQLKATLTQAKPTTLKAFYLTIEIQNKVNDSLNTLASAKVRLDKTTTNRAIISNLNSQLGSYAKFSLLDDNHADASEFKADGTVNTEECPHSVVCVILDNNAPHTSDDRNSPRADLSAPVDLHDNCFETSSPEFKVSIDEYIEALNQYKDRRYSGCVMADLTTPVTDDSGNLRNITPDERVKLHFNMKAVASERKDVTVLFSAPLVDDHGDMMSTSAVCDWVSASGDYSGNIEYGVSNTTSYTEQSFYLEMYHSWLNMKAQQLVKGLPASLTIPVAPSGIVALNVLKSFREKGVQYPVAGDQGGVLPEYVSVIYNPKTKSERDLLVSHRINPIYDTGTRGVQIYGNETLNAGYTDLNSAHIARMLVNIHSRVDDYTETLKFSLNTPMLWDRWKSYVSSTILNPLKSVNAIADFTVAMGTETTTAEEMANRMIRGQISLTFVQSAEIFDLEFTVQSSATGVEE